MTSNTTTGEAPNLSVVLTIRLLMQGKEVGSIIGKRGDHIKVIRDESGAKINISDGSCPERIVTITGNLDTITKAFTMICHKFEDDMAQLPSTVPRPPITFRLIVPATQCGSLIGKGGAKIKEIRDASGASLQVASEMLPSSTERAVTISGMANAIIQCMYQICHILLESPPKGAIISYRPKPSVNPLVLANSAAAAVAVAQQPVIQSQANAIYNQLTANELTKMHSAYNPLLQPIPGFNPAVINAGSSPYAQTGLIQLQAAAGSQQLIQAANDAALANAAVLAASGLSSNYTRTLDLRSLNGTAAAPSRDDCTKLNGLMTCGLDATPSASLSQYLINAPSYPSLISAFIGGPTSLGQVPANANDLSDGDLSENRNFLNNRAKFQGFLPNSDFLLPVESMEAYGFACSNVTKNGSEKTTTAKHVGKNKLYLTRFNPY